MKYLVTATIAVGLLGSTALAQEPMHIVTPATIKWAPAPSSLPKGAEQAVIAGDPTRPGPFAIRIRMPAHYEVPLHTHPAAENITVISGTILHGMSADRAAATPVGTTDYVYLPPNMAHAVWTGDAPAIVQINGTGPFAIHYVDPATDPRRQAH